MSTQVRAQVIQLRKACSHPYLFSGIEPEPYVEGEHLVEDFLELRSYTYERLDGSVRAEERFAAIRNFSSQSTKGLMRDDNRSKAFVFMISTRAGGVGLNLIGADTVIMRRAEKKLKLSHNIIEEKDATNGKEKDLGNEASDMKSIIFGLHQFDPMDTTADTINEDTTAETISAKTLAKLKTMSEKVVMMRSHEPSEKDDRAFEINPNLTDSSGTMIRKASDSITVDPGLEAVYLSWVKKFKEASDSIEEATAELGRQRAAPEEKLLKREANKKKTEEKRLAKWEALGYQSLAIKDPGVIVRQNIPDSGSVQLVYGDCTDPSKVCLTESGIIFSCIDNSGTWGHGGMFDALTSLSTCIPDAYHRASEFDDLHMGDLHLIQLDERPGHCFIAFVSLLRKPTVAGVSKRLYGWHWLLFSLTIRDVKFQEVKSPCLIWSCVYQKRLSQLLSVLASFPFGSLIYNCLEITCTPLSASYRFPFVLLH